MKVKHGFIKRWAHMELKVTDAIVNRIIKECKIDPNSSEAQMLSSLLQKYHERPLFLREVERRIYKFENKIRKAKTNKKFYKRNKLNDRH